MTLVWIDFHPSCSSDKDGPEIPLEFIPSGVEGVGGYFGGSRFSSLCCPVCSYIGYREVGRSKSTSWSKLDRLSEACAEQAVVAFRRQSWRRQDDTERRIAEENQLMQMGEIAFVGQAMEGAVLAQGTRATLDILRDPGRRPNLHREPMPDIPANVGVSELDETLFTRTSELLASLRHHCGHHQVGADSPR